MSARQTERSAVSPGYSLNELMVCAAAREIGDGELVLVGMRLPLIAFVVLMEHSRQRLPERVSYVTSPGNGDGAGWRKRAGLPRGGPAAVITTKAVLRFDEDGEAFLAATHPGLSVEDVVANTSWKLRVSEDCGVTPEPTEKELSAVREYDKDGFWTK